MLQQASSDGGTGSSCRPAASKAVSWPPYLVQMLVEAVVQLGGLGKAPAWAVLDLAGRPELREERVATFLKVKSSPRTALAWKCIQ